MNGPAHQRAFSLIELLVVIGVLGILISIIVPALRGARGVAGQTVCLSNLRGTGVTFGEYQAVNGGQFPFPPDDFRYAPPADIQTGTTISNRWDITLHWPTVVAPLAPWREFFPSWVCPGAQRGEGGAWEADPDGIGGANTPSYFYSHTFIARPQLWSGSSGADASTLEPVWESDVVSPSAKVMLWDSEMAHLSATTPAQRDSRPLLFADSHAAVHRVSEAFEPVQNPLRAGASPRPFNDTRDGVAGRDY